jgi:hypothetical protein
LKEGLMSDDVEQGRVPPTEHEAQSGDPLESPKEGYPTGESIGDQSEPAGKLNLEKDDVGFGPKGDEDTAL